MKEFSADERLRRLVGAADRELEAAPLADAERGDALYRACLGARQILDSRVPTVNRCAFTRSRRRRTIP